MFLNIIDGQAHQEADSLLLWPKALRGIDLKPALSSSTARRRCCLGICARHHPQKYISCCLIAPLRYGCLFKLGKLELAQEKYVAGFTTPHMPTFSCSPLQATCRAWFELPPERKQQHATAPSTN